MKRKDKAERIARKLVEIDNKNGLLRIAGWVMKESKIYCAVDILGEQFIADLASALRCAGVKG